MTKAGTCDACDNGLNVPRSAHGLDCPRRGKAKDINGPNVKKLLKEPLPEGWTLKKDRQDEAIEVLEFEPNTRMYRIRHRAPSRRGFSGHKRPIADVAADIDAYLVEHRASSERVLLAKTLREERWRQEADNVRATWATVDEHFRKLGYYEVRVSGLTLRMRPRPDRRYHWEVCATVDGVASSGDLGSAIRTGLMVEVR